MRATIFILILFFTFNCSPQNSRIRVDTIPKPDSTYLKNNLSNNSNQSHKENNNLNTNTQNLFKYIFPTITLLLGIAINRWLDRKNERKKIKRAGQRWKIELLGLEKPIESQIKSISDFLDSQNGMEFEPPILNLHPHLSCEIFSSLDKTELLKYLYKIKKIDYDIAIKHVNNVNSFLIVIKHNHEQTKKRFYEFIEGTSANVTKLNEALQRFMEAFSTYGAEIESENINDERLNQGYVQLLSLVNREVYPYMQDGNYNPYNLNNNFCFPVLAILADMRSDKRTYEMAKSTRECLNSIKGIRMERNYLIQNFENLKSKFEENLNELPSLYKKLD